MSELQTTIATEINRHHELASLRADEAVHHAIEAGKLLLQVKASMPHGQFLRWLEKNIGVSDRQARRYMAAAQGKPAPIRAPNRTPVSTSPDAGKGRAITAAARGGAAVPEHLLQWFAQPAFDPVPGHWYSTVTANGAVWLVPSLEHPEHFHISRLTEEHFDGTRRPVPAWMVETYLQTVFNVQDPMALKWNASQRPGLFRPFGEPEVEATGA